MDFADLEGQWYELDPVFIRGMQRSGTSVMARALQLMDIIGFGEGHLWFEIIRPIEQLRDPSYYSNYHRDNYTLGEDRLTALEKYIALALDKFHQDHLQMENGQWMDKSPGFNALKPILLLADFFPRAKFIFMYRNGITNVHSGINFWSEQPDIFETMCEGWSQTMRRWREVRSELSGRYIEIAQEAVAAYPFSTAARLCDFIGHPDATWRVANLFDSRRVLSSFEGKQAGDYRYRIDWSEAQKQHFIDVCGEEMTAWGYTLDFDDPGLPQGGESSNSKLMEELHRQRARIAKLEASLAQRDAHIEALKEGRVMRLLLAAQSWWQRVRGEGKR